MHSQGMYNSNWNIFSIKICFQPGHTLTSTCFQLKHTFNFFPMRYIFNQNLCLVEIYLFRPCYVFFTSIFIHVPLSSYYYIIILKDYSAAIRWIIVFAYTLHKCLHMFFFFKFLKQFYRTLACCPLMIYKQNFLNTSWVYLLLKSKTNIPEYFTAKFRCIFGIVWNTNFIWQRKGSSYWNKMGHHLVLLCGE